MTRSEAPVTTNPYTLSRAKDALPSTTVRTALARLLPLLAGERQRITIAFVATIVASAAALVAPAIIGRAVDLHIRNRDYAGVLQSAGLLLLAYLAGLVATYVQTRQMGTVG